jgi:hypothetical protein
MTMTITMLCNDIKNMGLTVVNGSRRPIAEYSAHILRGTIHQNKWHRDQNSQQFKVGIARNIVLWASWARPHAWLGWKPSRMVGLLSQFCVEVEWSLQQNLAYQTLTAAVNHGIKMRGAEKEAGEILKCWPGDTWYDSFCYNFIIVAISRR